MLSNLPSEGQSLMKKLSVCWEQLLCRWRTKMEDQDKNKATKMTSNYVNLEWCRFDLLMFTFGHIKYSIQHFISSVFVNDSELVLGCRKCISYAIARPSRAMKTKYLRIFRITLLMLYSWGKAIHSLHMMSKLCFMFRFRCFYYV